MSVQNAMWIGGIELLPVAFIIFFYIISQTARFSEKVIEHKMSVWVSLHLAVEILVFLTLRTCERDIIINVHRSSCKVPLLLSEFYEIWIFSTYFQKILKYKIS